MLTRRCLLGLSAFLFLGAAIRENAVQAEQLRFKFQNGQTQSFAIGQNTDIAMKIAGQAINMKMAQDMKVAQSVSKLEDSGAAHLKQQFQNFQMKMTGPPGASFEYDSSKKAPLTGVGAQIAPLLDTLAASEFEFVQSPIGAVSEFEVPNALAEKLKTLGPVAAQLGGQFSKEGLKQMIEQGSLEFPEGDLKKGQTWSKKLEMMLPLPVGKLTIETKYSYAGEEQVDQQKLQRIDTEMVQTFEGDAVKVIEQKSSGKILFDNQLGRLAQSDLTHSMKMELTVGGQKLAQEQTTTVKVRPLENAKPK